MPIYGRGKCVAHYSHKTKKTEQVELPFTSTKKENLPEDEKISQSKPGMDKVINKLLKMKAIKKKKITFSP
jgi:hypothetical protein